MACTVFLDSKTGKVIVALEDVDRAEVDGGSYRFYAGNKLVAVFNIEKVFGYELRAGKSIAD